LKTNKIIALLTQKEREKFVFVLKKRGKSRRILLFEALCEQANKKPDKSALFVSIFGQAYEKSKDYLLRNELRLLNADLIKFLSTCYESSVYDWQRDINVLRLYLQRAAYDLFEQSWQQLYQAAQKMQAWAALLDLVRLWADYEQQKSELRPQNFLHLLQLLSAADSYRQAQDKEIGAELGLFRALSGRYLRILGASVEENSPILPILPADSTAKLFFDTISKSHSAATPQERLAFLLQAQKHHRELLDIRPQMQPLLIVLHNNIGLEYFLLKNFDTAAGYFRLSLAILDLEPHYPRRWDVRFNAYSNMLFAGDYQEAIAFHRRNPEFLIHLPDRLFYRFHYLVAMAYLFDNQHENAFDLLAQLSLYQRPNNDYYYARLVFVCAYAAAQDWDNAERELINLLQTRRKKQKVDDGTAYCANRLKDWILMLQSNQTRREQQLFYAQMSSQIDAKINEQLEYDRLPLRWLLSRLKNE
jgi:hypothetical protein